MAFCSYCGKELTPDARFCSGCGSPVTDPAGGAIIPSPETSPAEPLPVIDLNAPAEYGLVLYSIGTCAKSYADDVLEDILGYSDSEAKQILKVLPAQIAQNLTMEQAQYIAQALTEYGMQVAVVKGGNAVDVSANATSSVFNSDGSFVAGALAALATISVTNRVRRIRRWSLGNLLSQLFRPRYRVVAPPRHVTRSPIRREPAPVRTEPRRAAMPQRLEPRRKFGAGGGMSRGGDRSRGGGRGGPGGPGGRGR